MADEAVSEFTDANIPLFTIGELDPATGEGDGATEDPDEGGGGEGNDDLVVLEAPELISPPDGYVARPTENIIFRWAGVAHADNYVIQWSTSSDFKAITTSQVTLTDTETSSDDFVQEVPYYWRVMAVNEGYGVFSPWSEVRGFSVRLEDVPEPPDGEEDPEEDDEEPDDETDLYIIKLTADPNPVERGQTSALDVEVHSSHGSVTYAWSIISGDGSLANATTKTPTYTASSHKDVVVIQCTVTDGKSNTASKSIVVYVESTWNEIIAPNGIQGGCTVDVSTINPGTLSAPAWGADGTQSDPGVGGFPTHGSKYSNGCEMENDLGVLIFNEGQALDWFRFYVSGYKVKLLYPMSKRSGKMKVYIERYDPRTDDVQVVGSTIIDQSADYEDDEGNDCWSLGTKEIRLGIVGTTTDDDEWDFDADDGSLDRYIYRLNFTMDSPVGDDTDSSTYADTFVGLIAIFVYREERDVVFVDTDAQWNAGTLSGCTVSDGRVHGSATGGSSWGLAGHMSPPRVQECVSHYWYTGACVLSEKIEDDSDLAAMWAQYVAASYAAPGDTTPVENYMIGILVGRYLEWNSLCTYGYIHYHVMQSHPFFGYLDMSSPPDAGKQMRLRVWFDEKIFSASNLLSSYTRIRLYQNDWDTPPSGVAPYFGTLKQEKYWGDIVTSTGGGPNGEDYYLDFTVDSTELNAEIHGGKWYFVLSFNLFKFKDPDPTFDADIKDKVFLGINTTNPPIVLQGASLYTSAVFNLGYVYDFEDVVNWVSNNRYFVYGLGSAYYTIEWRAGLQADISDGTWGSLYDAFEKRKIQYAQFRIKFVSSTAWVDKLYLLLKEGRPR